MSSLALLGGAPTVPNDNFDLFSWPIVTPEMEQAVLSVLRAGSISHMDVTIKFEREYANWLGVKYALAHNNGTAAVHSALFGLGVGTGDEIICPAMTFWASCVPVFSLGGTVVFADIDPDTLCIDPGDIERRITERTKAIIVVHYSAMPADMDRILRIAKKFDIAVLEDCSHAHGTMYKGRMVGTFGDAASFSLMSAKSFPIGEGGILVTDDQLVYERVLAFGHYARHEEFITLPEIKKNAGIPWGGYKYRLNQLCSAIGRVQLQQYPAQMNEIDKAMNLFWDHLEELPGIRSHRPEKGSGSTKGGWYFPLGLYNDAEVGGLSVTGFCRAVRAEGVKICTPGCNMALNTHPLFNTLDVYKAGKPTINANLPEGIDARQPEDSFPVASRIQRHVFKVPWFKHHDPQRIEQYAAAFRKVAENHEELIPGDEGNPEQMGVWGSSSVPL